MPVNSNIAVQTSSTIAWDGTAAFAGDLRTHTRFAWTFEVTTTLAADTVFKFQSAPADVANRCLPGAFTDVDAIPTCDNSIVAGLATVTLPAGTLAGAVCSGTLPCRPDAFIRLAAVSGNTANVKAVLLRQGPINTF